MAGFCALLAISVVWPMHVSENDWYKALVQSCFFLQTDIQASGAGEGCTWHGCYCHNTKVPGLSVTSLLYR